ncbi:TPA: hypothetical protein EYP44_01885 [Candidatus Bathyarchaeota archaeon]|nr:hypothetical protein [Candidatus Bathyarchaeota archaeon]
MAIRVRVRLRAIKGSSIGSEVETAALVNLGYEASAPDLVLPAKLAEGLGLWPPPREAVPAEGVAAGGQVVEVCYVTNCLEVELLTGDRTQGPIQANVAIAEREDEVLLSDFLSGVLRIAVEDPIEGLWRFRDEPLSRLRRSEAPRYWR